MSGLIPFSLTNKNQPYANSSLQKLYMANLALYVYNNGEIEITKNRYSGETGIIEGGKIIKILTNLLVKNAFNNTCKIFQEGLKEEIYEVLEKHKVLEGEEYDKI